MSAAPKILIIGANGQVGGELRRKLICLGNVIATDYPEIDLLDLDSARRLVRDTAPQVVINAAAYTAVDKAETDSERALKINGIAPMALAEEAKRLGSIFVHYSTDYVFDGARNGTYSEDDLPNPLNEYGKSKAAGDAAIQSVGGSWLIFRTSWVYGARGANFLLTMLRLAQQRPELRIVNDQVGAPTSSETIAQATAMVLAQVLSSGRKSGEARYGLYNLTTSGTVSWFGFASAILEHANRLMGMPVPRLVPIKTEEYPLPAKRPANSFLSNIKIQEQFGIYMPAWQDALAHVMETVAALKPAGGASANG